MYYDLNVPWQADRGELERIVAFLDELGYGTIALTHTLQGKLPADLTCPIPAEPFPQFRKTTFLRRCNVVIADASQNHRLPALTAAYDIIAARPVNQDAFAACCNSMEVDIISLDLTQRLGYHLKHKNCSTAIGRGIRFEICYAPSLIQADTSARRNLIGNAAALIRATRGRNIIISSEASRAAAVRAPVDMINMAVIWGLSQDKGRSALEREPRVTVLAADLKRRRFRGVVEIVSTGSGTASSDIPTDGPSGDSKRKRDETTATAEPGDQSKRFKPDPKHKS